MSNYFLLLLFLFWSASGLSAQADSVQAKYSINIELTIPKLAVDPYHKPFVAIWLETPNRKGKQTLAVWYDDEEWLKDLRQWWRKLGRSDAHKGSNNAFDGATGATRRPEKYTLNYITKPLTAGDYVLHIEAARESGGREHLKQTIRLDQHIQTFKLSGKHELGDIIITVSPQ